MSRRRIEIDGIAYAISTWGDDGGVAVWRKIDPVWRSDGRPVSSYWKQCRSRETAMVQRHFLAASK